MSWSDFLKRKLKIIGFTDYLITTWLREGNWSLCVNFRKDHLAELFLCKKNPYLKQERFRLPPCLETYVHSCTLAFKYLNLRELTDKLQVADHQWRENVFCSFKLKDRVRLFCTFLQLSFSNTESFQSNRITTRQFPGLECWLHRALIFHKT